MSTVAIIPARGGSKGIPRKNLVDFCGLPLLAWTIRQSVEAARVDAVYVTSDDEEILQVAERYGALPILRPADLSGDTATSEAALLHAIDHIETSQGHPVDLVVFLQATSPLRESADIDGAVESLWDQKADSLFSGSVLEDFFIFQEVAGQMTGLNFDHRHRPRRQDVKPQYLENGSMWLFKPWVLRQENNRMGGVIGFFNMELWKRFEIDSFEDLEICQHFFRSKLLASQRPGGLPRAEELDLVVYDFDGVMTDNRVMVWQDGKEAVLANRGDGLGVGLIRRLGLAQVIISTEVNPVVAARAAKLDLEVIHGVGDKAAVLRDYCQEHGHDLARVLFVGNDLNDLAAMKLVGWPAAPADAHPVVADMCRLLFSHTGGSGVVRELADILDRD